MPLFFSRGAVYRVRFLRFEEPRQVEEKYVVCLQQGKLLERRNTFTAVVMNSCKDNRPPREYPWSVYVSPADSNTQFGVIVNCSEIHTILKEDVEDFAYTLSEDVMGKIDRSLMYGIGKATLEEAEKRLKDRSRGGPNQR